MTSASRRHSCMRGHSSTVHGRACRRSRTLPMIPTRASVARSASITMCSPSEHPTSPSWAAMLRAPCTCIGAGGTTGSYWARFMHRWPRAGPRSARPWRSGATSCSWAALGGTAARPVSTRAAPMCSSSAMTALRIEPPNGHPRLHSVVASARRWRCTAPDLPPCTSPSVLHGKQAATAPRAPVPFMPVVSPPHQNRPHD